MWPSAGSNINQSNPTLPGRSRKSIDQSFPLVDRAIPLLLHTYARLKSPTRVCAGNSTRSRRSLSLATPVTCGRDAGRALMSMARGQTPTVPRTEAVRAARRCRDRYNGLRDGRRSVDGFTSTSRAEIPGGTAFRQSPKRSFSGRAGSLSLLREACKRHSAM
jgi:hypothetical protein